MKCTCVYLLGLLALAVFAFQAPAWAAANTAENAASPAEGSPAAPAESHESSAISEGRVVPVAAEGAAEEPPSQVYYYAGPGETVPKPDESTSIFYEPGYKTAVQEPRYSYDRQEGEDVGRYSEWERSCQLRARYDTGRYPGYRGYAPFSFYREEGEPVRGWSYTYERSDYHIPQRRYEQGKLNKQFAFDLPDRGFDAEAR